MFAGSCPQCCDDLCVLWSRPGLLSFDLLLLALPGTRASDTELRCAGWSGRRPFHGLVLDHLRASCCHRSNVVKDDSSQRRHWQNCLECCVQLAAAVSTAFVRFSMSIGQPWALGLGFRLMQDALS